MVLPPIVQKWAGLTSNSGTMGQFAPSLAGLNDGGTTFSEIAKIIKGNKEKLFYAQPA